MNKKYKYKDCFGDYVTSIYPKQTRDDLPTMIVSGVIIFIILIVTLIISL